ncbi:hypothetical protein [Actinacidiphila epipremni]|jgi:hypothetical protein|uniref:hypothetical protein n=1 Tax=Actinacidiphila epipremni TaxID=2053013 RepID=UPI0019CF7AE8|nr:hypothetical protein [Actinacidiphila epipremni]
MHRAFSGQPFFMELQERTVWVEEPARRPRMADPVRDAAVRAGLLSAVALVQALVGVVLAAGHSWLAAPVLVTTVVTSVVASWAVLDVWVTRQVWAQRDGVVSSPSSAARERRAERRRARRAERGRRAAGSRGRVGRPHIPRHLGV